jgi:hypothetical protein
MYVSYNEKKNGAFEEAVRISNQSAGLTWLDKSRRKPEELDYPTAIFVRLTREERYFRGILVNVKSADNLDPNFALGERDHRPSAWRDKDIQACPRPNKDFKSVFFISTLQEMSQQPREVENLRPPQGPVYVDL